MPVNRKIAEEYAHRAKVREIRGLVTYGDFDPATDKRILAAEAQEEVIDTYNYLKFLKKKHPSLKEEIIPIQVKACSLYADLRRLEAREVAANNKKDGGL